MERKYQKLTTVIGAFCMIIPNCLTWYWGNASVYALSYIVSEFPSDQNVEYPWMISIFRMSWIGSLILCELLRNVVSIRWSLVTAVVISECSLMLTYFSIQYSLSFMTVTLAFFQGIGTGILYGNSIQLVVQCANEDVGLLTSIIQAAFPSGSIIVIQLVTLYTNPSNKVPDLEMGTTRYFTQKDVIDKVPSMFFVLGAFSLTVHTLGLAFLQFNPNIRFFSWKASSSPGSSENLPLADRGAGTDSPKVSDALIVNDAPKVTDAPTVTDTLNAASSSESQLPQSSDLSPMEVVRKPVFYCLWILYFMSEYPYVLLTNYFKIYGQLWIHDDHFLANLGTVFVFAAFLMRITSGAALDRFGSKTCFICFLGVTILSGCWYYFTAMVNRWLYSLATMVYGGFTAALPGCYIACTAKTFGKTHVSTNVGLVMSSSILFNSIGPVFIRNILIHFGWFFTFSSSSILNSIGLMLCLLYIPSV